MALSNDPIDHINYYYITKYLRIITGHLLSQNWPDDRVNLLFLIDKNRIDVIGSSSHSLILNLSCTIYHLNNTSFKSIEMRHTL